jgi:hypothetical protein
MLSINQKNFAAVEIWKPIKGFEGLYEISNCGQVKSLKRRVKYMYGHRTVKEKILTETTTKGLRYYKLYRDGFPQNIQTVKLMDDNFPGVCLG